MRIIDANNDMVVEYVSSILAGAMLWRLPQTGMFTFAASAESSASVGKLLLLTTIQIAPEVPVDFFATWAEIKAGLIEFHRDYLRRQTWEGLAMKACSMVASLSFVLAMCLKT